MQDHLKRDDPSFGLFGQPTGDLWRNGAAVKSEKGLDLFRGEGEIYREDLAGLAVGSPAREVSKGGGLPGEEQQMKGGGHFLNKPLRQAVDLRAFCQVVIIQNEQGVGGESVEEIVGQRVDDRWSMLGAAGCLEQHQGVRAAARIEGSNRENQVGQEEHRIPFGLRQAAPRGWAGPIMHHLGDGGRLAVARVRPHDRHRDLKGLPQAGIHTRALHPGQPGTGRDQTAACDPFLQSHLQDPRASL